MTAKGSAVNYAQKAAGLPALVICLAGILTISITGYLAVRVYSPVWFADDWQVPMEYIAHGGHYPLVKLWAQHNEHRVPFVKASILLDLIWLHGNHAVLIAWNYFSQILEWTAFSFFATKLMRYNRPEALTTAGIAAFLIGNPNQLQNVEWAFSSFFTTYTFAILAIGGLCMLNRTGNRSWIAAMAAGGVLAEMSLASGVLVWLVLPITALLLGMSYRRASMLAGFAVFGLTVYLIGYSSPENATKPLDALSHGNLVVRFLLAYFGESWHYVFPQAGDFLAGVAIFLVITLAAYQLIWRHPRDTGEVFSISVALFCLMTGFVTSLGRQVNGVEQAREGRYQTPAMLFWCAVTLLLISGIRKLPRQRAIALIALQAIFCVAFVSEAFHLRQIYKLHRVGKLIRDSAGTSLESGVDALDRIRMIYPGPEAVPPTYAYLSSHGLMAPPLGMQQWMNKPAAMRFSRDLPGSCLGATDTIEVLGKKNDRKELYATGWAFYAGRQNTRMIATTEDGLVEGLGVFISDRPDILKAFPQVTDPECGWHVFALVPPAAQRLSIYTIVPETGKICELPSSKSIPQ